MNNSGEIRFQDPTSEEWISPTSNGDYVRERESVKDLLISAFGFCLSYFCYYSRSKFRVIPRWVFKFGFYAGMFTMLIYFLRLKLVAEEVDPESKEAYKEYLKLGSWYTFILFVFELPSMLAALV